ncbi:MAG: 3-dehydroquinate synthase [Opitutales bacterium]
MTPQPLNVELGNRSYPIFFERDNAALRKAVRALRKNQRSVRAMVDGNVLQAHPQLLTEAGISEDPAFSPPSGESAKSIEHFNEALRKLAQSGTGRDAALFAFGGGVVGDLAGYVAASYLRGIEFHQVPTTLLAMVDSSVGGKTGINLPEGKNLVGAFWQPKAVYINTGLLHSLPDREFNAGMAEVIKYGLLADAELFDQLTDQPALDAGAPELPAVIRRCCSLKAAIVRDDETESAPSGGRALLNLGHTFAHAIENVAGYGDYLHGEAVAVGLLLAARLSVRLGQLDASLLPKITALLEKYRLPTRLKAPLPCDALLEAMLRDKKTRSGKPRFVTLKTMGQAVTTEGVDAETIESLWNEVTPA